LEQSKPLEGEKLNAQQTRVVMASLANDETSTDEELYAYFVDEIGITPQEAKAAIQERTSKLREL
jgi:hypothetical protein